MRFVILIAMALLTGAGCGAPSTSVVPSPQPSPTRGEGVSQKVPSPSMGEGQGEGDRPSTSVARTDFSQFNPIFRFSAELPQTWQVEYVREIEALNVYGPAQAAMPARELSKIFVRYFKASDFLTLRTVDVLTRETAKVGGHAAVVYEIKKKAGVPDFPYQPSWRNHQHQVTDVRFDTRNPSVFYVFARNPAVPKEEFEKFFSSLVFHNDRVSFVAPLDQDAERITKKPFGLKVVPGNSPVQPERFAGYHTGVDFEILNGEETQDVEVRAFCGGPIREKRTADGYGGVVVQECLLSDQVVTVVYGHLKIESVERRTGEYLAPGAALGTLGAAFSKDTDGERKHLHFGIHKGTKIDIRGYMERASDLDKWLDPRQYITT